MTIKKTIQTHQDVILGGISFFFALVLVGSFAWTIIRLITISNTVTARGSSNAGDLQFNLEGAKALNLSE